MRLLLGEEIVQVDITGGEFVLRTSYEERFRARSTGAKWNAKTKLWTVGANLLSALKLMREESLAAPDRAKVEAFVAGLTAGSPRVVPATKTPLYEHQIDFASRLVAKRRMMNFSEMGSGKTGAVIGAAQELFTQGQVGLALIVAPLSVLASWERQIEKFCAVRHRTVMLTGTRKDRVSGADDIRVLRKALSGKFLIFALVNYAGLRVFEEEILALRPEFVCFDETTEIKNRTAKQTQSCMRVSRLAKYATGLTGTPISNNVAELWSECAAVSPNFLGGDAADYWNYVWEFCRFGGFKGKEIVGTKNLDVLEMLIKKFSVRVRKEEVLKLPPRTWDVREVVLEGDQDAAYRKAEGDFYFAVDAVKKHSGERQEFRILVKNALARMLRCQQIAAGHCRGENGEMMLWPDNPKIAEIGSIVEESGNQRIVVFSRFVEDLLQGKNALTKRGVEAAVYYGDVSQNDRADIEKDFMDPKGRNKVILAQVKTGGLGVDFSQGSICVFMTNWWSWHVRDQAESRVHRPGQTKPVTYIDLSAVDTVDQTVLEAIHEKKSISAVLFGKDLEEAPAEEEIATAK